MENVLAEMRVELVVSDSDVQRIPVHGAVVVTSNHPFGLLDGAVLGALLSRIRPDVKVLTNFMLAGIPELHEYCIFVDPFGSKGAIAKNRRGVRQALEWLAGGGMLAMFPSGEVSHFQLREMGVVDPEWNSMAARLVRLTGAVAIPVFMPGGNSATFQALGLLNPQLRTARLLNEFLQQKGQRVEVRVGSRISSETVRNVGTDREAASYLRWRTYILSQRRGELQKRTPAVLGAMLPHKRQQPVANALPTDTLIRDLEQLGSEHCLYENREYSVYYAKAREVPAMMQEIGRLREVTFRAAGEGTGRSADLDRFDHYYTHVLLWNRTKSELVGSYRLGLSMEILPTMGTEGLYTNTLFRYDPKLFERLGPALELGRSFIRPEYQRQYAPLLTLWKGIGRYLVLHPQFAVLFGAVSISNRYCPWSRESIFHLFQGRDNNRDGLAQMVSPRTPFRPRRARPSHHHPLHEKIRDLDQLADPIADVEIDGKSVPILLKHYARLGGRMLSFNVDKEFSDVLDGLVIVDLRESDKTALQRYMGEEGLAAFLSYHGRGHAEIPA